MLRSGDTLYVEDLDRLGRNKKAIKDELEHYRLSGIIVRVLDVPTTLVDFSQYGTLQRSIMDMVNNILIEVLGTLAEQELTIKKNVSARASRQPRPAVNISAGRPCLCRKIGMRFTAPGAAKKSRPNLLWNEWGSSAPIFICSSRNKGGKCHVETVEYHWTAGCPAAVLPRSACICGFGD